MKARLLAKRCAGSLGPFNAAPAGAANFAAGAADERFPGGAVHVLHEAACWGSEEELSSRHTKSRDCLISREFVDLNRQIEKKRASLLTTINIFSEASTRTQSSRSDWPASASAPMS